MASGRQAEAAGDSGSRSVRMADLSPLLRLAQGAIGVLRELPDDRVLPRLVEIGGLDLEEGLAVRGLGLKRRSGT